LALAKELVELHGGKIWAESEGLGKGTQMHVILPHGSPDLVENTDQLDALSFDEGGVDGAVTGSMADEKVSATRDLRFVDLERNAERFERGDLESFCVDEPATSKSPSKPLVLVVEDNGDMRRLLYDLLAKRFSVRVARNGREGLQVAREAKPDLILTDVMMPEMSGTELCREIKSDANTKEIPIILVTSKSEREMKIQGLEMGADDYVTKPFHPRELLARVNSLVRLYRLQGTLKTQNALLESTNAELESTVEELRTASSRLVQSERLAAVGELAAGVAHEVNNPVNFATNALRTLERNIEEIHDIVDRIRSVDWEGIESISPALKDLGEAIEKSDFRDSADSLNELIEIATEGLDRTGRLVGDLRDFALPKAAVNSSVDVVRGVKSTIQLLNYSLRDSGIQVVTDFEEGLPHVRGNAAAINQVFLNLLKNALDATRGFGAHIYVKAWRSEERVRVRIMDEGRGISEGDIGRLFEPFFTTKAAGAGTGLGLSISRRIALEHGGEIEVDSGLQSGSSFTLVIPIYGDGTRGGK
jgi:signal transduction histidine kinase